MPPGKSGNMHRPSSKKMWWREGQEDLPRKRMKITRGLYANFRSLNFILYTTENPESKKKSDFLNVHKQELYLLKPLLLLPPRPGCIKSVFPLILAAIHTIYSGLSSVVSDEHPGL